MMSALLRGIGASITVVGMLAAVGCTRAPNDAPPQAGVQGDTAAQLREADAARKEMMGRIEGRLSGEDKHRFEEAEQAWLAYRDANCDAEKALHDGESDQPHVEAACLARLANERRAELLRVYRNSGAD